MPFYLKDSKSDDKSTLPVNCMKWYHVLYDGFALHYHEAFEMIAVIDGEMKCTADERTYILKSGDIVLFNPYSIHSGLTIAEDTVYFCLTCSISEAFDYLSPVLKSCTELLENGQYLFDEFYPAEQEDAAVIMDHTKRMYEYMKIHSPASETIVLGEFYGIFSVLFERHYHPNTENALKKRNKQFMQNLSAYLKENYYKPITTNDAAKAMFLSGSQFSHLMKQYFGFSFSRYLRQYRIECAIKSYSTSNCTIKEIAEAVGFTDYCYFSHAFKEYIGTTPAVYFKKRKRMNPDEK